jgi:L-lactate dehydrogenase complex protein LldG
MERERFLARVRDRLAGVDAPPLPGELPATPASGDDRPPAQRFSEELQAVGGVVEMVSSADLAGAVASAAEGTDAQTAVVAGDVGTFLRSVTDGLGRAGVEILEPEGTEAGREACARADLGVTGALLGVASSGSILTSAGESSSRLASLLPPTHLVVLPTDRLVAGFEELFAALPGHLGDASSGVLISGPSRTADIEMVLVRGVHGPRDMHVLLVEEPRRASRGKGRPAKRAGPPSTP